MIAALLEILAGVAFAQPSHTLAAQGFSDQNVDVRINPAGLFVLDSFALNVDFLVSDRITVGPEIAYYDARSDAAKLNAYQLGMRANYALGGAVFRTGWIACPYLGINPVTVTNPDHSLSNTITSFYFGAMIGYEWFFPSGVNFDLAAGGGLNTMSTSVVFTDGSSVATPGTYPFRPALEASFGWAF